MSRPQGASNIIALTQFLEVNDEIYAYRRFGHGAGRPLLFFSTSQGRSTTAHSCWLSENLPNAVLLTYPDSGHGSLFQFHESFTRQATAFLASDSPFAPY